MPEVNWQDQSKPFFVQPEKEFDVTQVMGNAFAFVQDLNTEIYKVMGKRDGHYVFTLTFDRNNNRTELQIEEITDEPVSSLILPDTNPSLLG